MVTPTENLKSPATTIHANLSGTPVTLHVARILGFSSINRLTSVEKFMRIQFYHDDSLFELFGPQCLGKTLEIVSVIRDTEGQEFDSNAWTICGLADMLSDPDDKSRLLMEISIEQVIFGLFPEYAERT